MENRLVVVMGEGWQKSVKGVKRLKKCIYFLTKKKMVHRFGKLKKKEERKAVSYPCSKRRWQQGSKRTDLPVHLKGLPSTLSPLCILLTRI